ncbi:Zinc finger, C3HC4 type (RING finger) containing protein, putative [Leishmania donovani]|uniref:Zinc finger, C3HC4 type (RING finger) containing protein, putative n=1 Tax=Leishmania donovani TaxID=5661 RepID=A0A3Q8ILX4_LEIDO|nr:Zinc finger, C3HC4 type (RING finger) containing protein, putative [Leishmania donovani]
MPCGRRTSQRQPAHARGSGCSFDCARTPAVHGRTPGAVAAAAAAGASPSTLSSPPEEPVTEAAYRLSPQEVQRRAQQVLTAQARSLLLARLQERLQQARVAHAQRNATRSPPTSPAPLPVSPFDTHMTSAWPNSASSEAADGACAAPTPAKVESLSEEASPLFTTEMSTDGGAAGGATTRPGAAAAASAVHSPAEMSVIDVNPYSAVELVRVHRLKGVPNHNRGLFAGLSRRYFTTRSGHYTVGRDSEGNRRVRSGVSGFMWKAQRHSGAASGPPPRLTMRSLFVDDRILFQWTEGDSSYGVQDDDEFSGQRDDGTVFSNASDMDDAPLGHALKRMLEHTYGKRMTAEQRAEAARRLRERREGQQGTSGRYRVRRGKGSYESPNSSAGGDAMTDGDDSFLLSLKDGSSDASRTGQQRRVPGDKGSRSGAASLNSKRGVIFVQDLSPVEFVCDHNMLPVVDTPMLSAGATSHNRNDPLLTFAASGHRYAASADGGSLRHSGDGDHLNATLLAALSFSSLGHTMTADEAEAHRRKRHFHVGFENLSTGSRPGGGDGPSGLIEVKRSGSGTIGGRGAYGSLSLPSSGEQHRQLSHTACLYADEEMVVVDKRLSAAAGGPQGGAKDTSSVAPGARGGSGAAGGLGGGGRHTARRAGEGISSATGQGTDEGLTAEETQQRIVASLSEASISATVTSEDDLMGPLKDNGDSGNLDEFLTHFPEEENHVRLRRAAKNILDGVEDMWDEDDSSRSAFLLPKFLNLNFQFPGLDDVIGGSDGLDDDGGHDEGSADDEHESLTGFGVNEAELNEKFRIEAEEECGDLVAQRDALLAEIEAQRQLLDNMGADAHYLSVGHARTGMTAEQYAIMLTSEVSRYAKSNQLRLNRILEEMSEQQQKDGEAWTTIERAAYGFLDRFGKERTATADVGCQVSDADLCYVDAAVRSTEEQLEDLFMHEKALVNAVRLATVAVANIMTFHASLEMESTCHECFFVFDKPRTLWPCGHTFCLPCLSNMYNRRGELICSECGSVCEVGYTPNISVELVANYQTLCKRSESNEDSEPDRSLNKECKTQTVEGVLRSLLNGLLSAQSSWTAMPSEHSPLRMGVGA